MLGERSDQKGLWEADHLYLEMVGQDTFYGLLASLRGKLLRDADFAELYCPDNGRTSVAPSLLPAALLLPAHDKVSDARDAAFAGGTASAIVDQRAGNGQDCRSCSIVLWDATRHSLLMTMPLPQLKPAPIRNVGRSWP